MPASLTIAFISSAYNEAGNLQELHRRCREAHATLQQEFTGQMRLEFQLVVADNSSSDASLSVLHQLSRQDPGVHVLANRANYGPEASVANAMQQSLEADLLVVLCSDLQDPPEVSIAMVRALLLRPELDAVLAAKKRSAGSPLMRLARQTYYRILGYSSRLPVVPSGFHGFGCYRREVIEDALRYWKLTDLNLRQCLTNASQSPLHVDYQQADRVEGISSYRGWGYWPEAFFSLISGDAAASRIALLIGGGSLLLSALVGLLLLANFMRGTSGYSGGIPTVMGLVLLSFAVQMLMFSLLSRQIEALRMGGFRPKVHFQLLSRSSDSTEYEPRSNAE
jgi:glycosyltransferase involved in cell wall biosynthesis